MGTISNDVIYISRLPDILLKIQFCGHFRNRSGQADFS